MGVFLSVIFWVFFVLTIFLIYHFIDSVYSDGSEIVFIFFMWVVYGMLYFAVPVKTEYKIINDFQYERTESGIHVFYKHYNEFTNNIYLIENIEDTTKVEVFIKKNFNSSEFNLNSSLEIKRTQ